jgi:hypothetical protein
MEVVKILKFHLMWQGKIWVQHIKQKPKKACEEITQW